VFALFVVSPLLKLEGRLPWPRILGCAASFLSLVVAGVAAERLLRNLSSSEQVLSSAIAGGALGVLALEYFMTLPHRISRPHRVHGSIRDLLNLRRHPWRVPWDRAIAGLVIGVGAAGLPALALVLLTAPVTRATGVSHNLLYLGSTLILWQAGVAAVFGYYSFEPAHPATAASASSQSPCE